MMLTSSDGTSYIYDAVGQRAQISKAGNSKEYYYFGGQLVATLNPSAGTATGYTDFIYADGQKIAVVAGTQAAVPIYTLPDHLGSEVASTNSNESSAAALDYMPFGQILSGSSTDSLVFTGLERDASGLDHAGFRQYSSTTARWTTPDPYDGSYSLGDPQSLNRYTYARNNPLAFTDTLGLQSSSSTACTQYGDCGGGADGGCDWCGFAVDFATLGLDFVFQASNFGGNVQATHGPGLRNRVNADGSINAGPGGPDGAGGNGFSVPGFIYGDPISAPSNPYHMIKCTGVGRGLAGNANLVGRQGGIPGQTVQLNTAAVTPTQFNVLNGAALSPFAPYIYGTVGNAYFTSITDVNGGRSPIPGVPVRTALQQLFPGQLIPEIPGAQDQGANAPVTINVPQSLGCPAGTHR